MSNVSQFLGGRGTGSRSFILKTFYTSGVFVAPKDCTLRFSGVGAGGSGAVAKGNFPRAVGGAAGGFLPGLEVSAKAGDTFVITVGAGGAGVTGSSPTYNHNGNSGGDSSIVGPGVSVVIEGGEGGSFALGSDQSVASAEGGEVIGALGFKGGSSGEIAPGGGKVISTGGGAVNLLGFTPEEVSSGDVLVSVTNNLHATGGASPGGRSQDNVTGGGAGMGGAPSGTNGGPDSFGRVISGNDPPLDTRVVGLASPLSTIFAPFGGGGPANNTRSFAESPGSGTGGMSGVVGTLASRDSGAFAGTGACAVDTTSTTANASSGKAGLGAGSGGIAAHSTGSGNFSSGAGGDALIIVEVL